VLGCSHALASTSACARLYIELANFSTDFVATSHYVRLLADYRERVPCDRNLFAEGAYCRIRVAPLMRRSHQHVVALGGLRHPALVLAASISVMNVPKKIDFIGGLKEIPPGSRSTAELDL